MSETQKQENFEDQLFNNASEQKPAAPAVEKRVYEEQFTCPLCEDAGACNQCARGRQWLKENPFKDESKDKKKK